MRVAVAVLLGIHGMIHVLGFLPARRRGVGILWLLAAGTLIAAGLLVLLGVRDWWAVTAVGVVLSQGLVISQWRDAKAGTIANVIFALAAVFGWADARFQREGDSAVRKLFADAAAPGAVVADAIVTEQDLAPLPDPVRNWVASSGVIGRPRVNVVRLRQRGGLRTSPKQDFMPAEAEQYFSVDPPSFVWRVDVRMKQVLPIAGRDSYVDGKGRMEIRAFSLIPLADAGGYEIDQGALIRYLGEIVWFPTAALSPYIRWEALDARSARATMTYGGVTASAEFFFAADGRVLGLRARRYHGKTLENWFVPIRAWGRVNGVLIPTEGDVYWQLGSGSFDYYRWEILDVDYDRPELYRQGGGGSS